MNYVKYRYVFIALAGLAVFLPASVQAVGVTILNPPASVEPGETYSINVTYAITPQDLEKRMVFFLELCRAGDNVRIAKSILDNGATGYAASSGTLPFQIAVPANAAGLVYFKAWAIPWSLNRAAVAHYKSYPTNGTFTYLWGGGGHGVTQNVYYRNTLICPKPAGNTTYCSGLSFEAFLVSFNNYNTTYGHATINSMTSTQMESFRRIWYGVTDTEKLAARSIPEYGLGLEITNHEEAQEGDPIQFWRWNGSGHNPVFVNWLRNGSGQITGVRYWGSQGSTNGIGYNSESFGTTSGINRARFYIGRPRKPRDQADYDWALGSVDTAGTPSSVGVQSSVADWTLFE